MRKFWAAAGLALALAPAYPGGYDSAAQLRDRALTDKTAWELLESLCYEVGPRPVGSPAAAYARDWSVAKLQELGFTNIKVEAFAKPSWRRGAESLELLGREPQSLSIIGLGGSVATPKAGITAEIAVVADLRALQAAPVGAFRGKIVLVNQIMPREPDGSGYGKTVAIRYGASEAAKRGAVAYLIRSVSTGTGRSPHAGHSSYAGDAPKIPAAAIGVPDADRLAWLAKRRPVRVRLSMQSAVQPNTLAWNVSGEIEGSEMPDQVVVIGGHIDSWDNGLGAMDDGVGVTMTMAAGKLIGDLPRRPKRTVRVVLFGSEETGGASEAYLEAHKDEVAKLAAVSESDLGADQILAIRLPKGAAPAFSGLKALLAPLGIALSKEACEHPGADVSGLVEAGVPPFCVEMRAASYFDYHHSADDSPAIIDKALLAKNVAAWAALVYALADSDVDLRSASRP